MPRRFVTEGIAPVRLSFREAPQDFEVEEVPLYAASGAGDHVYATIEKRGLSTSEAVRGIARRLGLRASDIGVAGQKDAKAVARQTISIEHLPDEARGRVEDPPRVKVIAWGRHSNKIKMGHLKGNRFKIRMKVPEGPVALEEEERSLRAGLERLEKVGVPNYFGPQRFGGENGKTHLLGRALLRGEAQEFLDLLLGGRDRFPASFAVEKLVGRLLAEGRPAASAVGAIPKDDRQLYVSAAQSAVFNALLDARMDAGALARLEAGDVAYIHAKGACFVVEDAAAEQPRAERFEISPAGPIFGTRLLEAGAAVLGRERAALAAFGVTEDMFRAGLAPQMRGARRPYRIRLEDVQVSSDGPDSLLVAFFLPAGSYATAVVAELLKREVS